MALILVHVGLEVLSLALAAVPVLHPKHLSGHPQQIDGHFLRPPMPGPTACLGGYSSTPV